MGSGKLILKGELKPCKLAKTPQRKVLRCPNDGDRAPFPRIKSRAVVIEPRFDKATTSQVPVFLLKVIEKEREPDIIV